MKNFTNLVNGILDFLVRVGEQERRNFIYPVSRREFKLNMQSEERVIGRDIMDDNFGINGGGGEDNNFEAHNSSNVPRAQAPSSPKGGSHVPSDISKRALAQGGLYIMGHMDEVRSLPELTTSLKIIISRYKDLQARSSPFLTLDLSNVQLEARRLTEEIVRREATSIGFVLVSMQELMARMSPEGRTALLAYGASSTATATATATATSSPTTTSSIPDIDAAFDEFHSVVTDEVTAIRRGGWGISLVTKQHLLESQNAAASLTFLNSIAHASPPISSILSDIMINYKVKPPTDDAPASSTSPRKTSSLLSSFLTTSLFSPPSIQTRLYPLLLSLLSQPIFKHALAKSYVESYREITEAYAVHGVGGANGFDGGDCNVAFGLSVQFLNRTKFVSQHIISSEQEGNVLVEVLGAGLEAARLSTYEHTKGIPSPSPMMSYLENYLQQQTNGNGNNTSSELDPNSIFLSTRRYAVLNSDLKCLLHVPSVPFIFASRQSPETTLAFESYCRTLCILSGMDCTTWVPFHKQHLTWEEGKEWVFVFNAAIGYGGLFDRIWCWGDVAEDGSGSVSGSVSGSSDREWIMAESVKAVLPFASAQIKSYVTRIKANRPDGADSTDRRHPVTFLNLKPTTPFSFHHSLICRFFTTGFLECVRLDDGVTGCRTKSILECMRSTEEFLPLLLETSLNAIVRLSEIRAGDMWRRNDERIFQMAVNFGETPFCKLFRDMDLFQVIIAATAMVDQTPRIVQLILVRFGVASFVLGEEPEENVEKMTDSLYPPQDRVKPLTGMLEDVFLLFNNVLSETPSCNHGSALGDKTKNALTAIHKKLRSEILHSLAFAPKTKSAIEDLFTTTLLQSEVEFVSKNSNKSALIDDILDEIACKQSSPDGPDTFSLVDSAWKDFDGCFFHLSGVEHQKAVANRPNIDKVVKGSKGGSSSNVEMPLSPHPGNCHPVFEVFRQNLISDISINKAIFHVMVNHLTTRRASSPLPTSNDLNLSNYPVTSDLLLSRAVQLLTNGAHLADDSESYVDDVWCAERQYGDYGSVVDDENCAQTSILALLNVLATQEGGPDKFLVAGARFLTAFAARSSPRGRKILQTLNKNDSLVDSCKADIEKKTLEQRKKEAKERQRKQMEKFAKMNASFAAGLDDEMKNNLSSSSLMDSVEDLMKFSPDAALVKAPKCSICSDEETTKGPVGFCTLVQPPLVLMGGGSPHKMKNNRFVNTHLSLCGHAVHASCLKNYQESIMRSAPSNEHTSLDLLNGEFACPMCKRLSNALVPFQSMKRKWAYGSVVPKLKSDDSDNDDDDDNDAMGGIDILAAEGEGEENMAVEDLDVVVRGRYTNKVANFIAANRPLSSSSEAAAPIGTDETTPNTTTPKMTPNTTPTKQQQQQQQQQTISGGDTSVLGGIKRALSPSAFFPSRRRSNTFESDGVAINVPQDLSSESDPPASPEKTRTSSDPFRMDELDSSVGDIRLDSPPPVIVARHWPYDDKKIDPSRSSSMTTKLIKSIFKNALDADAKRLGGIANLATDFGNFRFHLAEQTQISGTAAKTLFAWPSCLATDSGYEEDSADLEPLVEKGLNECFLAEWCQSCQTLAYSILSEGQEVKRVFKEDIADYERFLRDVGARGLFLNNCLVVASTQDQNFAKEVNIYSGRLGRLRNLANSLMGVGGEVCEQVLYLTFLGDNTTDDGYNHGSVNGREFQSPRLPIIDSVLDSHVLSYTTMAMVAVTGRSSSSEFSADDDFGFADSVNCYSLGLIARVLQSMLELTQAYGISNETLGEANTFLDPSDDDDFASGCIVLAKLIAASAVGDGDGDGDGDGVGVGVGDNDGDGVGDNDGDGDGVGVGDNDGNDDLKSEESKFQEIVNICRKLAFSFCCDAALVLQVLQPLTMQRLGDIDDEDDSLKEEEYVYDETTGGMVPAEKTEDGHLKKIMRWIGVGSLSEILASDSVKNRATSWLSDCKSIRLRHRHRPSQKRLGLGHVCDWPIAGVVEVIDSFDLKRFFRGMEEEGWLWDDSGASTGLKASLAVAELSSTPPSFDFDLLASTSPNASASASASAAGVHPEPRERRVQRRGPETREGRLVPSDRRLDDPLGGGQNLDDPGHECARQRGLDVVPLIVDLIRHGSLDLQRQRHPLDRPGREALLRKVERLLDQRVGRLASRSHRRRRHHHAQPPGGEDRRWLLGEGRERAADGLDERPAVSLRQLAPVALHLAVHHVRAEVLHVRGIGRVVRHERQ